MCNKGKEAYCHAKMGAIFLRLMRRISYSEGDYFSAHKKYRTNLLKGGNKMLWFFIFALEILCSIQRNFLHLNLLKIECTGTASFLTKSMSTTIFSFFHLPPHLLITGRVGESAQVMRAGRRRKRRRRGGGGWRWLWTCNKGRSDISSFPLLLLLYFWLGLAQKIVKM